MEDISQYTYEQLIAQKDVYQAHINRLDNELNKRKEEEIFNLRADFLAKANMLGVSMDDILNSGRVKKSPGAGLPKYANPDNPKQTWTGKGKKPGWFIQQVDAGVSPESMLM